MDQYVKILAHADFGEINKLTLVICVITPVNVAMDQLQTNVSHVTKDISYMKENVFTHVQVDTMPTLNTNNANTVTVIV